MSNVQNRFFSYKHPVYDDILIAYYKLRKISLCYLHVFYRLSRQIVFLRTVVLSHTLNAHTFITKQNFFTFSKRYTSHCVYFFLYYIYKVYYICFVYAIWKIKVKLVSFLPNELNIENLLYNVLIK